MNTFNYSKPGLWKCSVVVLKHSLTLCAVRLSLLLTLLLLELHVTVVKHSTSELVDAILLLTIETQNINSIL